MDNFLYKARDRQGQLATGEIAAASIDEAGKLLQAQNKFVVEISPMKKSGAAKASRAAKKPIGGRVKRKYVIDFANQMSVMVNTGVPLSEALDCLRRLAKDRNYKAVMDGIAGEVQAGSALSDALAKHPKAFPPIVTALIRASESSGTMSVMFDRIAKYLTKEYHTLKQVRGAMMYPMFMFLMCASVTVFLLTVILPRFTSIYANKGAVLPAPTRFLMALSDGITDYWQWWLVGLAVGGVGFAVWVRTTLGQTQLDWLKLHVPICAGLTRKLYLSRACRTIGTMIDSGVSLLDTVHIVRDVTRNVYYERLWDGITEGLGRGEQLSDSLFASALFPESVSQMVYSGEKSGRLGEVFGCVADFTETEFDVAVKTATQFIEPVMLVVMGSVIGFIAISLLLPVFSAGRVMSGV